MIQKRKIQPDPTIPSLMKSQFNKEKNLLEQFENIAVEFKKSSEISSNTKPVEKVKHPALLVLFSGPSGTGKTLAAKMLGEKTGKEVFRIDLSRIISKYIGETEKNLSALLEKAEKSNSILFFDEADALFGKRTNVRSSHDKYANQEVSYFLEKIKTYHGIVIISINTTMGNEPENLTRFRYILRFDNDE
jgi:SpoVK/Ycf46/Vps4 family AAA+-type ATPase